MERTKRTNRYGGRIFAAAMAMLVLAVAPDSHHGILPGVAHAAELPRLDGFPPSPVRTEDMEKRRVPNMSETTYRKFGQAQELIDPCPDDPDNCDIPRDPDGAITILLEMLERQRRYNGNELGQIHQMLAVIYYNDKDDLEKTFEHYEQLLAQVPEITEGLEESTIKTLAQLHLQAENFDTSLDYMKRWFALAYNPGPGEYILVGQIHFQRKDFPAAAQALEAAITLAGDRELTIRENWWAMLNYAHFEMENYDRVIEILEILVRDFPKRQYWIQLAGVYGQEGQEREQLMAFEAAHVAGFLDKESDVMTFGGLLMQNEVPWRGAKYMQVGLDSELVERTPRNLQQIGQAYQLAQEVDSAIGVFEEAGEKSDDGEIYDRLSSLYLEKDEFSKCRTAAERAMEKGGIKKLYNVEIVLGMCQFNLDELRDARETFVKARRNARDAEESSAERITQQWIRYIDNESKRRAELDAAGI